MTRPCLKRGSTSTNPIFRNSSIHNLKHNCVKSHICDSFSSILCLFLFCLISVSQRAWLQPSIWVHSLRIVMDAFARSSSRPRPSSRPTTPLRPSSRSSIREAHGYGSSIGMAGYTQPAINALEPQFAELADSMADLEANFMHLQLMHESLTRFSESFASFLYGLNMNAFCVDFPEVIATENSGCLPS